MYMYSRHETYQQYLSLKRHGSDADDNDARYSIILFIFFIRSWEDSYRYTAIRDDAKNKKLNCVCKNQCTRHD